jgi:hypothetical protein
VPALTGGRPIPLGVLRAALVLVNGATALRVTPELVGSGTTLTTVLLAVSGPLAFVAVAVFAAAVARSLRSAFA